MHAEPYDPPQPICCLSRDVTCYLVLVVSVQLLLPSGIVSHAANVCICVTLNIPSAFKITPLSVQLPHCLATHLSASDSLRPWRYINLLTYLLTYLHSVFCCKGGVKNPKLVAPLSRSTRPTLSCVSSSTSFDSEALDTYLNNFCRVDI